MKALKALTGREKIYYGTFLLCLIASLAVSYWVMSCELIMTSDSWQYISAAASFREQGIFLSPDGSPYVIWPPLFPVILSQFDAPEKAMVWMVMFCKVVTGVCIFYLSRFFQNDIFRLQYFVVVFLGVHLLLISVFLWSEIIFIALMLVNICLAFSLKQRSANFYLMLVTGFLFCLQRNAGLFIVAGTSLWMLLNTDTSFLKRMPRAVIYFLVCTSGQWIWNIYNLHGFVTDTLMSGSWFFSAIPANLFIVLAFAGKLFLPVSGSMAFVSGTVVVIIVLVVLRKEIVADTSLQLIVCLAVCYVAGYVILPVLDVHETDRYFSVIVPFILLMFFKMTEGFYLSLKAGRHVFIAVLCLWMIYPIARTAKNAMLWHDRSCAAVSDK